MIEVCVWQGDIICFVVDVIVNVVNFLLFGGGGVDGVIYCVVGVELVVVCCLLYGCKIGEVKIICGFCLLVVYVIYIVGLVWCGGDNGEVELLVSCYWCSLVLVEQVGVVSVVFFVISCGIYGYFLEQVVVIVVEEVCW